MESKCKKKADCIAVFGTGSDVGKSIITAALCRFFVNQGLKVAPFKAQNMSNNSGVTPEGLEMGRAQIVQAEAANVVPSVDMNPVLLKPTSQTKSQVILMGKVYNNTTTRDYHENKEYLFGEAKNALDRLREGYDLVIIEGAGSCAEVNLMSHDIVNFRIAEYCDASVFLVADIHKGGIFAQLVGTLECLPEKYKDLIKGFIINRFKGDISLFQDGVEWIEKKTSKQVFGVLPWFNHFQIDAEDSFVIENVDVNNEKKGLPEISVIRIPHISNFTDFQPLTEVKGITLRFIENPADLSKSAAVIIPGSKNTIFDLQWIYKSGWSEKIKKYADEGGHVLGICGGYQMLGKSISDPESTESTTEKITGLSLLDIETTMTTLKTITVSEFMWEGLSGTGYEIHMGLSVSNSGQAMVQIKSRNGISVNEGDGCIATCENVQGTYIHGFFDTPEITEKWLSVIGVESFKVPEKLGLSARTESYDKLAEHFVENIDMDRIIENLKI